jgi:hypothetical protein
MPAANVIQLRQLLKEKLPELRLSLGELFHETQNRHWPTGLRQIDDPLAGGLPKGALTEIVAERPGLGSASLIHALLRQAASENQIIALVDGQDSFDATQSEEWILSRLLWVRCHSADEALKATDLLLRDRNVPLLLLDLIANPAVQLRKIPATTWFRFQRILEPTSTVGIVLTPRAMVSPAQARITLKASSRASLDSLERERSEALNELKLDVMDARHFREATLRNSV